MYSACKNNRYFEVNWLSASCVNLLPDLTDKFHSEKLELEKPQRELLVCDKHFTQHIHQFGCIWVHLVAGLPHKITSCWFLVLAHYRKALERADLLLSMKHGISRLDNIWGVSGGTRPVKQLSKKVSPWISSKFIARRKVERGIHPTYYMLFVGWTVKSRIS